MDPNPNKFPILSYVLSRIPQLTSKSPTASASASASLAVDIEQPAPPPPSDGLISHMPHLSHPEVLASMTVAVSDVAQTRCVLQALGDRPDHETVDNARAKISEIETALSKRLEEIVLEKTPDGVDRLEWRERLAEKEKECRQAAEKEKSAYKAVVQLEEMHNEYEKLLKEAEERLVKIYDDSVEGAAAEDGDGVGAKENEEVNEEVVSILQDASGREFERVDLSGKRLTILPEAFGKLRGLVSLNLSSNQLEVIPDSVAGLERLEELNLSYNLLESLPDSIGLLQCLKILNVSSNKLKALPDSISHCRSLVELDASFNKLTYLPTNIGYEFVDLQRLFIHLNKIRSLPSSVCEMRSLRHLDAHFNELRGLPFAIGRLTSMEILDLSSNFSDLTELPETFGDLVNLRELDLSNNQIHALPDTFGRLDSLTKLNLDQNPLIIPPVEIVSKGVEAVKEFMAKRLLDKLIEEEKSNLQANQAQAGWVTRSTSWLNNWVSTVSERVAGYVGAGDKSPRDPYLDQQL